MKGNQVKDRREIQYTVTFVQKKKKDFLDNRHLGRTPRMCLLWADTCVHTSSNQEDRIRRGGIDRETWARPEKILRVLNRVGS